MANNPTKQGMIKIVIMPNLEHLIIRKSNMDTEAQRLLKMFIIDGYKSATGKVSKRTATAMMKYVDTDKELQQLITNCDYAGIAKHQLK